MRAKKLKNQKKHDTRTYRAMKPAEVRNGIYWVGAVDWAIRDFHGYETPRGTSVQQLSDP